MTVSSSIALAAAIWWIQAPAKALELRGFPTVPSFEDNAQASFTWNNARVLAHLDRGGIVSISLPNQSAVRMIFPGARVTSAPQGEGSLKGRSFYYLGAANSWHSTAHFER